MKKIRINELARELEVKPQRILDLLPELGVEDKKTHSSSLDDDVAEMIRRHFGADGAGGAEPRDTEPEPASSAARPAEVEDHAAREAAPVVFTAEATEEIPQGGVAVAENQGDSAPEAASAPVAEG